MGRTKREEGDPVLIKKYANRRLYNTTTSSYVTLDDLAHLVSDGEDIKVVDAKSGDDLTHSILTQIILDKESKQEQMLSPGFLRQLIALYGNGLEKMVPDYLMGAMENLAENQERYRKAMMSGNPGNVVPVFEEMTRQNMQLFQNTMRAFTGNVGAMTASRTDKTTPDKKKAGQNFDKESPENTTETNLSEKDAEIARLKHELAMLKSRNDQS